MRYLLKTLILMSFFCVFAAGTIQAAPKKSFWSWGKKHHYDVSANKYNPYLENSRHLQIPQWTHESWYAEDWTAQRDPMTLIRGFYTADILRDQITDKNGLPVLVVGPNFYRLSGYDKRRVAHVVDVTYGVSAESAHGVFTLQDWRTHHPIGVFDENGLRLH